MKVPFTFLEQNDDYNEFFESFIALAYNVHLGLFLTDVLQNNIRFKNIVPMENEKYFMKSINVFNLMIYQKAF